MIFYFSATGNSKHAAKNIAEKTEDKTISITDCLKSGKFDFTAKPNENIGFISPVYSSGLPITVIDFIQNLNIKTNNNYIFTLVTFGSFTGGASHMMKNMLKEKGLKVNAQYSVRMPDTWTPVFDLTDREKNAKINLKADNKLCLTIRKIKHKTKGNYDLRRFPFYNVLYKDYDAIRYTSSLSVDEGCTGCGICVNLCPVKAIEIKNGKPVRVKEKCAMCLGCLHHCPQFAIQRGNKTKSHGQYVHKETD